MEILNKQNGDCFYIQNCNCFDSLVRVKNEVKLNI